MKNKSRFKNKKNKNQLKCDTDESLNILADLIIDSFIKTRISGCSIINMSSNTVRIIDGRLGQS